MGRVQYTHGGRPLSFPTVILKTRVAYLVLAIIPATCPAVRLHAGERDRLARILFYVVSFAAIANCSSIQTIQAKPGFIFPMSGIRVPKDYLYSDALGS